MSKRKATPQKDALPSNEIELKGYITNLSPMKRSKTAKPFFNLNVETEDSQVRRVVCFSPHKRRLLEDAEAKQLGVCITKAGVYENGTVKIMDNSSVKQELLGFKPTHKISITKIFTAINETPLNANINITGVLKLQDMEAVEVEGANVPMRKGIICDETDHINIVFWREYADLFNDGDSYILTNMRRGTWNNEPEVSSTSGTAFKKIEDLKDYKRPQEHATETHNYDCTIVGAKMTHTTKCLFCNDVFPCLKSTKPTIDCPSCDATVMISANEVKFWSIIVNTNTSTVKLDVKADMLPKGMGIDQIQLYLLSNKFDIDYLTINGTVTKLALVKATCSMEGQENDTGNADESTVPDENKE